MYLDNEILNQVQDDLRLNMMKKTNSPFLEVFLLIVLSVNISFAQDLGDGSGEQEIIGGTVQYEQFTQYDFSVFGDGPVVKEWLAGMSNGQKSHKILYFLPGRSLYKKDVSVEIVPLDEKAQIMIEKMAYVQPPNPVIKEVYIDFEMNSQIVQVAFMTRFFLIEKEIESQAWKPGTNQRKIQGYVCMDATMKRGKETITAWFTPNIPVSVGPENYRGLPGLILAVDINGDNVLLATSVDHKPPPEDTISQPTDGRKVTQEAFNELVAEKVKEYEEIKKSKSSLKRVDK